MGLRDRDVVVGEDVVGQRFQCLVEVAGRIEETGLEEPFDDVVFCLLGEGALGRERAQVGRFLAGIGACSDISIEVFSASVTGTLRT